MSHGPRSHRPVGTAGDARRYALDLLDSIPDTNAWFLLGEENREDPDLFAGCITTVWDSDRGHYLNLEAMTEDEARAILRLCDDHRERIRGRRAIAAVRRTMAKPA